jgi:hypothetical protein
MNVSEKHTVSIFRTVCFSETLVFTHESARRHNPEQQHRLPHRRENLKSDEFDFVPYASRVNKNIRTWIIILIGKPKGKRPLGVDRIILKWILRKCCGNVLIQIIWLWIGTGDWLLWTRLWTLGFHKRRGISYRPERLLSSQEEHNSMKRVSLQ